MINELNTNTSLNNQLNWELLKYDMKSEDLQFPLKHLKRDEQERKYLENKIKYLENVLDSDWQFGKLP